MMGSSVKETFVISDLCSPKKTFFTSAGGPTRIIGQSALDSPNFTDSCRNCHENFFQSYSTKSSARVVLQVELPKFCFSS